MSKALNEEDLTYIKVCTNMKGHNDTVTSLALSNCGSYVLSNSMDNTLRVWDVRPFVPKGYHFVI